MKVFILLVLLSTNDGYSDAEMHTFYTKEACEEAMHFYVKPGRLGSDAICQEDFKGDHKEQVLKSNDGQEWKEGEPHSIISFEGDE